MLKPLIVLSFCLVITVVQAKPAEECLGKLVFTVPDINNFEWAMVQKDTGSYYPIFSKGIYLGGSDWYYRTYDIKVYPQQNFKDFERIFTNYEINYKNRIQKVKNELKIKKEKLNDLINYKNEQQILANDESIGQLKEEIAQYEQQLDNLVKHPVVKLPLNYPYSFTVYNDMGYFWSNNYTYSFRSMTKKPHSFEKINNQLAGFTPRDLGEVPKSLGFCFPYGFIEDKAKADYEIKNAFRFKDQPNVIYAIYTGTTRIGNFDVVANPSLANTGTVAKYGILGHGVRMTQPKDYFDFKFYKKTISFGDQGEMVLNMDTFTEKHPIDPKDPLNGYFITGEIRGTMDNKVADSTKPYIGFQIVAYPKNTDLDYNLTRNAPTPEEAIEKVMPLLKTIHLGLQTSVDSP